MAEVNAKLFKVGPQGQIELLHQYEGWSRTWHSIVALRFNNGLQSNLLFYDRIAGMGRIYRVSGQGQISLLKEYAGWSQTWDHIVPLGVLDTSALLFYDRAAGRARFYDVEFNGSLALIAEHTNWRKGWDVIANVATTFDGAAPSLFLYDRSAGEARLFTVNTSTGVLSSVRDYSGWKKTWDIIVPGAFSSVGTTNLLLYRRVVGEAKLLTLDGSGNLTLAKHYLNWRKTWDVIVVGHFLDSLPNSLLCYDRVAGRGEFMSVGPQGELASTVTYTNWRKRWGRILAASLGGGNTREDLLFYDNTLRLRVHVVKCADGNGKRDTLTTAPQVQQWVDRANRVFGQAGVLLEFDPATDFESVQNTQLNSLAWHDEANDSPQDAAEKQANYAAAENYASQFPDQIVVFIRYGFKSKSGSGMSGPAHKLVVMPGFNATVADIYYQDGSKKTSAQNISLFGHEIGHFVGLYHTHVKVPWTDSNGVPVVDPDDAVIAYMKQSGSTSESVLDNDRLSVHDTPPDIRGGYFTLKGWNPADMSKEVTVKSIADGIDINFNPDRHNLMSYFNCDDYDRLSPDQARRIREWLVVKRQELLASQV
jgi:hypothetical protein